MKYKPCYGLSDQFLLETDQFLRLHFESLPVLKILATCLVMKSTPCVGNMILTIVQSL